MPAFAVSAKFHSSSISESLRAISDKRRGRIKSLQVSWKSRIFIETLFHKCRSERHFNAEGIFTKVNRIVV